MLIDHYDKDGNLVGKIEIADPAPIDPNPAEAITLEERINDLEIAMCEMLELLAEAE